MYWVISAEPGIEQFEQFLCEAVSFVLNFPVERVPSALFPEPLQVGSPFAVCQWFEESAVALKDWLYSACSADFSHALNDRL